MDSLNTHNATPKTQSIYYWLDGYWVSDKEEAELMDSINAFGSLHQRVVLPGDYSQAQIQAHINQLLKE